MHLLAADVLYEEDSQHVSATCSVIAESGNGNMELVPAAQPADSEGALTSVGGQQAAEGPDRVAEQQTGAAARGIHNASSGKPEDEGSEEEDDDGEAHSDEDDAAGEAPTVPAEPRTAEKGNAVAKHQESGAADQKGTAAAAVESSSEDEDDEEDDVNATVTGRAADTANRAVMPDTEGAHKRTEPAGRSRPDPAPAQVSHPDSGSSGDETETDSDSEGGSPEPAAAGPQAQNGGRDSQPSNAAAHQPSETVSAPAGRRAPAKRGAPAAELQRPTKVARVRQICTRSVPSLMLPRMW